MADTIESLLIDAQTLDNYVIDLTQSGSSWLKISQISDELKKSTLTDFQAIFDHRPKEKGVILFHDLETGKNSTKPAHRYHQSYYQTPVFDADLHKCNYMFNPTVNPLPHELLGLVKDVGNQNSYNQVVVNWYEKGDDFIPYHNDWMIGATEGSDIANVTLTPAVEIKDCRLFTLKPRRCAKHPLYTRVQIIARHGSIITMGGKTNTEFRHGVPKHKTNIPRVSVSLRKFD